jgi:hypothetical protein
MPSTQHPTARIPHLATRLSMMPLWFSLSLSLSLSLARARACARAVRASKPDPDAGLSQGELSSMFPHISSPETAKEPQDDQGARGG